MAKARTISILLVLLMLASCSVFGSGSSLPTVERVFVSTVTFGPIDRFALSPDGKRVINEAFTEIDLNTGEQSQRFMDTAGLETYGSTGGFMGWSVDGRYLAATQMVLAPDSTILDRPVVIIDTQTNTARYYKGAFNGWSAVNSARFLTNNWTPTNLDGSEVRDWISADFRTVAVKGNEQFLWDVNQNLPIAIVSLNYYVPGIKIDTKVIDILSFSETTLRFPIYTEKLLEQTVSAVFDHSGRYVLLTIWERSEIPPEGNDEIFGRFVVDTALVVVDWRKGEYRELFRLSSIGDGNVVALPNKTAWSADGSTIFVARKDAPAVVLKVKYP